MREYYKILYAAGRAWNVSPDWLGAIMEQESGGRRDVVSSAGAKGPMQFMPETAKHLGITNPENVRQAVWGAAKLLHGYLARGLSPNQATAAYFAGPDTSKWGPKTHQYVADVADRTRKILTNPADGAAPQAVSPEGPPASVQHLLAHLRSEGIDPASGGLAPTGAPTSAPSPASALLSSMAKEGIDSEGRVVPRPPPPEPPVPLGQPNPGVGPVLRQGWNGLVGLAQGGEDVLATPVNTIEHTLRVAGPMGEAARALFPGATRAVDALAATETPVANAYAEGPRNSLVGQGARIVGDIGASVPLIATGEEALSGLPLVGKVVSDLPEGSELLRALGHNTARGAIQGVMLGADMQHGQEPTLADVGWGAAAGAPLGAAAGVVHGAIGRVGPFLRRLREIREGHDANPTDEINAAARRAARDIIASNASGLGTNPQEMIDSIRQRGYGNLASELFRRKSGLPLRVAGIEGEGAASAKAGAKALEDQLNRQATTDLIQRTFGGPRTKFQTLEDLDSSIKPQLDTLQGEITATGNPVRVKLNPKLVKTLADQKSPLGGVLRKHLDIAKVQADLEHQQNSPSGAEARPRAYGPQMIVPPGDPNAGAAVTFPKDTYRGRDYEWVPGGDPVTVQLHPRTAFHWMQQLGGAYASDPEVQALGQPMKNAISSVREDLISDFTKAEAKQNPDEPPKLPQFLSQASFMYDAQKARAAGEKAITDTKRTPDQISAERNALPDAVKPFYTEGVAHGLMQKLATGSDRGTSPQNLANRVLRSGDMESRVAAAVDNPQQAQTLMNGLESLAQDVDFARKVQRVPVKENPQPEVAGQALPAAGSAMSGHPAAPVHAFQTIRRVANAVRGHITPLENHHLADILYQASPDELEQEFAPQAQGEQSMRNRIMALASGAAPRLPVATAGALWNTASTPPQVTLPPGTTVMDPIVKTYTPVGASN